MLGEARIEVKSIIMRSSDADSGYNLQRVNYGANESDDKNSASELLEKLLANSNSDKRSEKIIDEQQVMPACLMIGA